MPTTGVDEYLRTLANGDRRRVLEYMRRGQRRRATVDELVEHLRTHKEMRTNASNHGHDRVRISLVQMYLPHLASNGLVEWDREREVVHYRENEVVEAVLDTLAREAVPVKN